MDQNQRLGNIIDIYRTYFGKAVDVIIDAGTRDGDDAAYLAEHLQPNVVVAVDANPVAAENTRNKYPDFIVVDAALANFDGVTKFTRIISDSKDFAGSSSISIYSDFGMPTETIEVDLYRMDTLIKELRMESYSLDVVKVDLEGYTYEFLEGMGELVTGVKLFHLETEKFLHHRGHKNWEQVKAFMNEKGFRLVDTSYEWGADIEDQIWVNIGLSAIK
jgi:FkbM family methyltransferase